MTQIIAYLNFDGKCREAMTFYQKCLGAELQMMPFSEMPGDCPPEAKDRIMHARLADGSTPILMASDCMPGMPFQQGNNFWVSVTCESLQQIESLYQSLGEGGTVRMPLQGTFWAERFGMFTDRFGINWMLNFEKAK